MKAVMFLLLVSVSGYCLAVIPISAGDKPVKLAPKRTAQLKAAAKSFRLDLLYHGDQDKPYYRLTLSVPVVPQLAIDPFHPIVQITEDEAVKVIDQLAVEGFLEQAKEKAPGKVVDKQPCYTLSVRAGDKAEAVEYSENLGWGLPMYKRLEGIKAVLPGKAAKSMDPLLARLEGHRKEWVAEQKFQFLFSDKPVPPERDLPKEAHQARPAPDAKPGAFSKLVAGSISTVTVTYFNPKALKGNQETEEFLRRLLTTPKGSTHNHVPWAQRLDLPTVTATVKHTKGEPGIWLVWDGGQSVYCAYKDGTGRWWFGVWFQGEIPR